MRGLKPPADVAGPIMGTSHLLQMRGLKLSASTLSSGGTVASFTDAWIETCKPALKTRPLLVASFTDAWIETNYRQKEHRHH